MHLYKNNSRIKFVKQKKYDGWRNNQNSLLAWLQLFNFTLVSASLDRGIDSVSIYSNSIWDLIIFLLNNSFIILINYIIQLQIVVLVFVRMTIQLFIQEKIVFYGIAENLLTNFLNFFLFRFCLFMLYYPFTILSLFGNFP